MKKLINLEFEPCNLSFAIHSYSLIYRKIINSAEVQIEEDFACVYGLFTALQGLNTFL